MCDRSIPFYQMVLHGVVPMAAEPMNYTGDFASDRLSPVSYTHLDVYKRQEPGPFSARNLF